MDDRDVVSAAICDIRGNVEACAGLGRFRSWSEDDGFTEAKCPWPFGISGVWLRNEFVIHFNWEIKEVDV